MAVSGNLRTMPFPDVMQWISVSRKTGTLVIKGQRYTKKILFQTGLVSAVTSNNPREHLGYYLVGWGILTEEELEHLLDRQKELNVMLGELLVQTNRLTREQVDHLVRLKTEETIYDLMHWNEGEFFFLDDVQPRRDFKELQLPVDQFIMEGARQLDERRRISAVIPDSGCVPRVVQAIDETRLTPAGAEVLAQIDGARTIEEIALACRMPQFPVLSFVYQGVQNGVFELMEQSGPPRKIPGFYRSTWRDRILEAESSLALGDILEAYRKILEVRDQYSNIPKALSAAEEIEKQIVKEIETVTVASGAILELALAPKDLVQLKCAPEEGFLLSRVNGRYTVAQILALLPGGKLYNQLIIHNLIQRGVLKLRESQELVRHPGAPRLRT
ncbi:MAG TPA: DUF4388 domain-containing protein [Thermoanaerobaculaceae bacterium]|nr:DUF4388 domain-containing protein [Thermoanaerobaculaceae bacterium]